MGFALQAIPQPLAFKPKLTHESARLSTSNFSDLLEYCTRRGFISEIKQIHGLLFGCGFTHSTVLTSKLVRAYSICGSLEYAQQVFDEILQRDVVVWNSMIRGYVSNGSYLEALKLFPRMLLEGVNPDSFVFPGILKACTSILAVRLALIVHGYMIKCGLEINIFVGTSLVNMYAKSGNIELAQRAFDAMSERGVASYNALFAGYIKNGHLEKALGLFRRMQVESIQPNSVTVLHFLSAAASVSELCLVKEVHGLMIRNELDVEVMNLNSLINVYSKCGCLELACRIFYKMVQRNVVSWNALIGGYNQNGYASDALLLFMQMQRDGMKPDSVTVTSGLAACANLEELCKGKEIHAFSIRNGFWRDPFVGVALIDLYAKCKCIEEAQSVFDTVADRDILAWGAIIVAYAQNGYADVALDLLRELQRQKLKPNSVILASVLAACAHMASLGPGKEIHGFLLRRGIDSDVFAGTSLLDMYCKCGDIGSARYLFESLQPGNIVTWTSMMGGYGMHGYGEEVLTLFERLKTAGLAPDHVTFVSVLSACSHQGMVKEGWRYFNEMYPVYGIVPRLEHYTCMVDLMGRAGLLNEAYKFIKEMLIEPDRRIWGALLGACKMHSNLELGKIVAARLFELEPQNFGNYLLLSDIYDSAGRWAEAEGIDAVIKGKELKKSPGCSWIEVNRQVHVFSAGDNSHPDSEAIYNTLEKVTIQLRNAGYVPTVLSVEVNPNDNKSR